MRRRAYPARLAAVISLAVSAFLVGGCASTSQPGNARPMTMTVQEMASQMAQQIVRSEAVRTSPYKLVVEIVPVQNVSRFPVDNIIMDDVRATLNQNAMDRIVFVTELKAASGIDDGRAGSSIMKATHSLTGTFRDLNDRDLDQIYWQCSFQLVDNKTGIIVWEGLFRNVRPH